MNTGLAGAATFCLFALSLSKSGALEAARLALAPAATPVVVFGPEPRATIDGIRAPARARLRRASAAATPPPGSSIAATPTAPGS